MGISIHSRGRRGREPSPPPLSSENGDGGGDGDGDGDGGSVRAVVRVADPAGAFVTFDPADEGCRLMIAAGRHLLPMAPEDAERVRRMASTSVRLAGDCRFFVVNPSRSAVELTQVGLSPLQVRMMDRDPTGGALAPTVGFRPELFARIREEIGEAREAPAFSATADC